MILVFKLKCKLEFDIILNFDTFWSSNLIFFL